MDADRVLRWAASWARRRARRGEPWWLVVAALLWVVRRQPRRGELLWRGRVASGSALEIRVRSSVAGGSSARGWR